jgi:ABC-type multidrug transport system fused ATPase/permease subunit
VVQGKEYYRKDLQVLNNDNLKGRQFKKSVKNLNARFLSILSIFFMGGAFFTVIYFQIEGTLKLYTFIRQFEESQVNKLIKEVYYTIVTPYIGDFLRYCLFVYCVQRFGEIMHKKMILRTLHADFNNFYDKYDQGLILNRFATDMNVIDDNIFYQISIVCTGIGLIGVEIYLGIKSTSKYIMILYLLYYIMVFYIHHRYICFSKDLQRLDFQTRTPIFQIIKDIVEGREVIKIFGKKEAVIEELIDLMTENSKNIFKKFALEAWLNVRMFLLNLFFLQLFSFIIITVFLIDDINANIFVIYIDQVFRMIWNLKLLLKFLSRFENMSVAVERCNNYTKLDIEKNYFNYLKKEKELRDNLLLDIEDSL